MWNGKNKAITFSFDDAVIEDKRIIEILDKYGLKATFNLTTGFLGVNGSGKFLKKGEVEGEEKVEINGEVYHYETLPKIRIKPCEVKEVYKNHEVGAHSIKHWPLTLLDDDTVALQIEADRQILSKLCGKEVVSFAYPCGGVNCDERVANVVKNRTGVKFARSFKLTNSFELPKDLLMAESTVRFVDYDNMINLAKEFINTKFDHPVIFSMWGHGYEMLDDTHNFEDFERFCKLIANKEDIFYGTNGEVYLNIK